MSKNLGSKLLNATGKTQEEIAKVSGSSLASVNNWISGNKKPGAAFRVKLLELFKIDITAWDSVASPPKVKAAPDAAPPVNFTVPPVETDGDAQSMARELQTLAKQALRRLQVPAEGEERLTQLEAGKVMSTLATTLERLSKVTGEHEITQRRIMKLPFFLRIKNVLGQALKTFPDAARAVAEAMEQLDREAQS